MTTSNYIIISTFEDPLYLPLEAVYITDSLAYVYTKSSKRQVVVIGEQNDNDVIIEQGLVFNEKVLLSQPEKVEKYKWSGLELMEVIKERERRKQEIADSIQAAVEAKKAKMKMMGNRKMKFVIQK